MENKTNQTGSQNRNRSRNRNRNRNRGQGSQQGNRGNQNRNQGGGNRNRNRNRSRKPKVIELTLTQKIIKAITFGAVDPNKKNKAQKKSKPKPKTAPRARTESSSENAGNSSSESSSRRAPKIHEVTSPRLYVGNLDYDAMEADLEELFKGVGTVLSAEVVTNSRTQQSKGFAFVEMSSIEEAKRAVDVLHDQEFMGRKLLVSGAKSEGPRSAEAA